MSDHYGPLSAQVSNENAFSFLYFLVVCILTADSATFCGGGGGGGIIGKAEGILSGNLCGGKRLWPVLNPKIHKLMLLDFKITPVIINVDDVFAVTQHWRHKI